MTKKKTQKDQKRLHNACGNVLESILSLLSTSKFVNSVDGLLDRPNESLRRKILCFFFFQAEDGIRDLTVTGVQTCALPICSIRPRSRLKGRIERRTGPIGAL